MFAPVLETVSFRVADNRQPLNRAWYPVDYDPFTDEVDLRPSRCKVYPITRTAKVYESYTIHASICACEDCFDLPF